MKKNYSAFISYRHKAFDAMIAALVQSHLERYTVPKALVKKGYPRKLGQVFRDKTALAAAPDLNEEICRALLASESLIVVCTKQTTAADSHWINREISYFLEMNPQGKVFAVLAEGEPDQVFPPMLRQWKDPVSGKILNVEPVAADIRGKNILHTLSKIPRELLRIYAELLDVDYAELAQRHQQRQRRNIAAAAATVLTVILSFTGMLLVKNHQIHQANVLLQQQKDALLDQSAQLLTQDAREALAEGEVLTAIEKAAGAMDAGDGTLYPYAPAESVLISALDLFDKRDSGLLLTNTRLEAEGPVDAVCFSDDGTVTVLADRFGGITAFETRTGRQLWQNGISAVGDQEAACSLLTLNDDAVLAFSAQDMAAFSLRSGDLLWRRESVFCQCDEVFLSPDRQTLGYIQSQLDNTQYRYRHTLVFLRADTGQPQQELFLGEDPEPFAISFPKCDQTLNRGCFSADGTLFAGTYQQKDSLGQYVTRFYLADLTHGALQLLNPDAIFPNTPLGLHLDDGRLLIISKSGQAAVAAQISALDLNTGEVLWNTLTPEEESAFENGQQISLLMNSSTIYLLRKDRLYFLQASDGLLLNRQELPGSVLTWNLAGSRFQSLVLENGEYTLSWLANRELRTAEDPSASFLLGDIQAVRFWNNGFLRGERVETGTAQIFAGDLDSDYGFAAVVPRDDDRAVIIRRPLFPEETAKQWNIALPENASLSNMQLSPRKDGTLALFPVVTGESTGLENNIAVLDSDNHTLAELLPIPDGCDPDSITLLPEDSGYVETRRSRVNRFTPDGRSAVLSREEVVPIPGSDWYDHARESAAITLPDGSVLTVLGSEEGLTLWKNGSEESHVSFPGDLNWSSAGTGSFRRVLAVGASGHVVLSHYGKDGGNTLTAFAVYDSSRGTWGRLEDLGNGNHKRPLALGTEKPLLAAVDADGLLRIYDLDAGTHLKSIPLKAAADSVLQVQFLPGDTIILLKTSDSRILIYHTESAECLFSQQLPWQVSYSPGKIRTDAENQRLYLIDSSAGLPSGSPNCLCLDMTGWTPLFTAANVVDFDPDRSELYVSDASQTLLVFRVPGTRELLEAANKILSMN